MDRKNAKDPTVRRGVREGERRARAWRGASATMASGEDGAFATGSHDCDLGFGAASTDALDVVLGEARDDAGRGAGAQVVAARPQECNPSRWH